MSLTKGQRDALYEAQINPIANFPGDGMMLYGQKTLYPANSALNRISTARLMAHINTELPALLRPLIFEPNDDTTRMRAHMIVDSFLGDIESRRGLYSYAVQVDGSNNTSTRICPP